MRTSKSHVIAVVALSLVTVCGLAAPAAAVAPVEAADQQANGACNYADLYDQTIESVVAVQRTGGQGSGFVYQVNQTEGNGTDSTSYVVTNAHVVGDAANVTVQFTRGEARTGVVVGTDVYSDLAVVRVNETPGYVDGLPVSENQTHHGQAVAALGNPLGLDETITHGIVSGLNRSMPTQLGFTIPDVVQTDAPISPGNSGGPLVTCEGEVVGVNTAGIAARGAENIGFAVSSTTVNRVVPSLIETGEYEHPTLGVSVAGVTPAIAEANNLTVDSGVMIIEVDPNSPAAEVLQGSDRLERVDGQIVPIGGDVVVAVEGQNVSTTEDLGSVLERETRPGDEVNLTVIRDGERVNVTTTVTERPEPEGTGPGPTTPGPDSPGPDAPGPDTPEPATPDAE